ncbi:MAG: SRPBCC family protein [Acidobacteriaceae bacterium]
MVNFLERVLLIPRPRAEVFPFFADARNLERITPPWLRFQVVTPWPIEMRPGALIDYRLGLYGVGFRWRTRIEEWSPPESFVDVQLRGPYRRWRHRHSFAEVSGGTLMRDVVEYEVGWGWAGAAAQRLFVRRSVEEIFEVRNRVIGGIFGSR